MTYTEAEQSIRDAYHNLHTHGRIPKTTYEAYAYIQETVECLWGVIKDEEGDEYPDRARENIRDFAACLAADALSLMIDCNRSPAGSGSLRKDER